MRPDFPLGRIAGVRTGVHWSVVLVFGLIAYGLAAQRLPTAHPGRSWTLYTALGLAAALLFLLSLLAHELAHAVVARRHGIPVEDITLWLLGGATRLRDEAPGPAAEARVAGAGPLVSVVLGLLCAGCAWAAGAGGPVAEAVAWLAAVNLLLGVFNALPAAPLDGGRLLRAFLWWRTGDRLRAAVGAATAGRVLGWALVVLGVWGFVSAGVAAPLWVALVGWFIVVAATAEGRQARMREAVAGVPVRASMTADPVTVPSGLPAERLRGGPAHGRAHRAYPVTDKGGRAVGLVTPERAARADGATVGEVMRPLAQTRTARPDEPLSDLLPRLDPGPEDRVLVLADGRPVGVVTPADVDRTVRRLAHRGT
ncbi:site-2 protease family protein [Streptomyces sp. RFCAC02]|uniref:site-2 protease family protein n=1 Tax=Streptomyces sp. RFCAC02 TaxID=2499143 RepID=UPI00102227C9|nr:site-2 protease family protein [Streptomyces sp. RFCAC02]